MDKKPGKKMVQHYPVEDNEYQSGRSRRGNLAYIIAKAKRKGISQNLNIGGTQIARAVIANGEVTIVMQPAFAEAMVKQRKPVRRRAIAPPYEPDLRYREKVSPDDIRANMSREEIKGDMSREEIKTGDMSREEIRVNFNHPDYTGKGIDYLGRKRR